MKPLPELLDVTLRDLKTMAFRLEGIIAALSAQQLLERKRSRQTTVPAACVEFYAPAVEACRRAGVNDSRTITRCACVLAAQATRDGYQVARLFDISPLTLRRWQINYKIAGVAGLVAKKSSGRPPRASAQE